MDNHPPEPHKVVSELRFIDILPYKQEYQFVEGESGDPTERFAEPRRADRSPACESESHVRPRRGSDHRRGRHHAAVDVRRGACHRDDRVFRGTESPRRGSSGSGRSRQCDESATAALDKKDLPTAQSHEEAALKSLVSVRQNLRKLLSLTNGGQMSAARSFDRQQAQKIRRPPQDKKKQLEADLLELAKREEEFSEEIEAKGGGGAQLEPPPADEQQQAETPPEPGEPTSSPDTKRSGKFLGKDHEQGQVTRVQSCPRPAKGGCGSRAAAGLAQKDKALTELAKERLNDAAKLVQEASREMDAGRSAEAAEKAREAARKLESAARQVGALKSKELADRLARERDLAQAIAKAERELGKSLEPGTAESKPAEKGAQGSGKAGRQRELAGEVAALADVLDGSDPRQRPDYRELAQTIAQAARRNPPREVEDSMRRNAEAIASGRNAEAARDADQAAQRLEALAQDLEAVRRSAVQPQLERLLAAEKQAAQLQEKLRSLQQQSQLAEAEKGMCDLAGAVDKLAPGEGSASPGCRQAHKRDHGPHTGVLTRDDKVELGQAGYFIPPVGFNDGVLAVALALQARIQEIILDSALAERDGPVPPRYKELVEDYYRVLSQDLR